jgi:proteasome lid subunit RPN8/RPN11
MPDKSDRLDVAQLAERALPEGAFPAKGKKQFRVYFDRAIHERMAAHAAENLSVEICGILVGDWFKDENGPYVLINEAIRADKAQSNTGDVKLTHDDWTDINRQMDTKFTDRKIVGWYHSHPNFGIFLSQYDIFVHQYTFNSPGQIAYVVDPVNGLEGVFCWHYGKVKLLPSFWVGDDVHLSSEDKERQPSSALTAAEKAAQAPSPEPPPPAAPSILTLLLAAACTLLLGYLLGGMRSGAEQLHNQLGAVDFFCSVKGLRPGMREKLSEISDGLGAVLQQADRLASENVAMIPAPKKADAKDTAAKDSSAKDTGGKDQDPREEKRRQWVAVLTLLAAARSELDRANMIYGLSPEETAEVQRLIDEKKKAELMNVPESSSGGAKSSGSHSPAKSSGDAAKPGGEKPAPPKPSGEKSPAPSAPSH